RRARSRRDRRRRPRPRTRPAGSRSSPPVTPHEPLTVWPVRGLAEVQDGDDLAALLVDGLAANGLALRDGDVLVVSSKIVSKALGLVRAGASRAAALADQSAREVARRVGPAGHTAV